MVLYVLYKVKANCTQLTEGTWRKIAVDVRTKPCLCSLSLVNISCFCLPHNLEFSSSCNTCKQRQSIHLTVNEKLISRSVSLWNIYSMRLIYLVVSPEPPVFGLLPQPCPLYLVNSVSPWAAVLLLSEEERRKDVCNLDSQVQSILSPLLWWEFYTIFTSHCYGLECVVEYLCWLLYNDWGRLPLANPVQFSSETSVFCCQGWLHLFLAVLSLTCTAWRNVTYYYY